MTIKSTFKTAIAGLTTHKSRSALTVLGIVIGITAIILIMSVGQGAQNLILGQVQGMGSKTIAVIPGREPTGPTDVAQIFADSLKERDLEFLRRKENVPGAREVMPVVFGSEAVSYLSETYRPTVFGASELIAEIFDIFPEKGTFFTEEDIRARANVIVIGAKVKDELFGPSDAIGEKIRIKGQNFRVVGVLPKKGQVSFFNFDELAVIPYTTAQQYIFGIKYFHRFIVDAESEDVVDRTVRDIQITLRNAHGITDPDKDDFFVQTSADLAERLSSITDILTLFLTSIAAISLVVGGIGIMNIMLVSVTERTKEIGLRKAIGATEKDILRQFLFESVILTGMGGIIGVLFGGIFSFIVSVVLSQAVGLDWAFSLPVTAVALGIGVSGIIGLVFGIYPARQAAIKNPIDALRYE